MIKFECHAKRPDGERLYRLIIDGEAVRENLTIDDVVRAINARDEKSLGANHAPRAAESGCAAGSLRDGTRPLSPAEPDSSPCRGAQTERKNRK